MHDEPVCRERAAGSMLDILKGMKRKNGYIFGGRWKVVKHLGQGGQGDAYLVHDLSNEMNEPCVLKELKDAKGDPPKWRAKRLDRFKREIAALDRLKSSERIASVVDSVVSEPTSYYVTPFVGDNLMSVPRLGAVDAFLRRFRDIVEAVHDAHGKDVIHRDIKPNNVTVDSSGRAFLVDFGISRGDDEESELTGTMEPIGNRSFAAPECEPGSDVETGLASDVYSLGKLLYWMASDGKKMAQQHFNEDKLTVADPLERHYVGVAIQRTVREEPGSRWSTTELLDYVDWMLAKLSERAALRESGLVVLVDGFGPGNSFYVNGMKCATRDSGNPPGDYEIAEAFKVARLVSLERIDIAVALFRGYGRLSVTLMEGGDEAPSDDVGDALCQWDTEVGALPSNPEVLELTSSSRKLLDPNAVYWVMLSALDGGGEIGWFAAALELHPRRSRLAERAVGDNWRSAVSPSGPGQALRVLGRDVKRKRKRTRGAEDDLSSPQR